MLTYRIKFLAIIVAIVGFVLLCVWWVTADHGSDEAPENPSSAPATYEDRPAGGAPDPDPRQTFTYPSTIDESGNPAPTAPATTPLPEGAPDPSTVDRRNVDAVAETVAALAVSWDTRTDDGPAAGIQRAGALLTPELLAKQVSPLRGGSAGWAEPATHHAHSVADLHPTPGTDRPADTETRVHRAFLADYTWHGDEDWSQPGQTRVVNLTLDKRGEDWIVTAYSYLNG